MDGKNPRDPTLGDYLQKVVHLRRNNCESVIDTDHDDPEYLHRLVETAMQKTYKEDPVLEYLTLEG